MRGFNRSVMINMIETDDDAQRKANGLAICSIPEMQMVSSEGFGQYDVRDVESRGVFADGLLVWVTL